VAPSSALAPITDDAQPAPFPGGAAIHDDEHAWVLVETDPERSVGAVMAWASQRGLAHVDLLTESSPGVVARRAALFRDPLVVWRVSGRQTERATPDPLPPKREPSRRALDHVASLHDAGLDIVIEHGEVAGEWLGLEVARVVVDDAGARVEVGVGRHDREAFAMIHGEVPAGAALEQVIGEVRRHRRPGDLTHPLARLAAERWLRAVLVRSPELVGATQLEPAEPTLARDNVGDPAPAIAVGRGLSGEPVVVAASTGVDLDLVPAAADARLAHAPGARLVLALPERDALPVTRRLAARLVDPADVVTVPADYRA
jgi:hypothetical protein